MKKTIKLETIKENVEAKVEGLMDSGKIIINLYEGKEVDLSGALRLLDSDTTEVRAVVRFAYYFLEALDEDTYKMFMARIQCLEEGIQNGIFYSKY